MFKFYYRVTDPTGTVRFESLFEDEAVQRAQEIFRTERIFCEVTEIERS